MMQIWALMKRLLICFFLTPFEHVSGILSIMSEEGV